MHWDKDRSGFLEHKEFRAFLLSLGKFAISQVPDEEGDEEWERIIKRLDPNGDGKVSFDEFIAFMVEESADAESADQLLEAFRVLSNGQQYVLASDLQRELSPELYEYCVQNMSPYEGGPEGALDYSSFANALYGPFAIFIVPLICVLRVCICVCVCVCVCVFVRVFVCV